MNITDHGKAVKAGTANLYPGERAFKPSIFFVPSAVLVQVYLEFRKMQSGLFSMFALYRPQTVTPDPEPIRVTLGSHPDLDHLRDDVDRLDTRSHEPQTGRTIILTAYNTFTSRVAEKATTNGKSTQIDLDDEESSEDADSNILEVGRGYVVRSRPSMLKNAEWNIVVLDGCPMVKDPISTRNKQVNLLDRRGLLLMSAAPLLNHLRDIEGYLNLMWDPAWPFD